MPRFTLPTFYYHDHFMEMLDSLERVYQHILDDTHRIFLESFRCLTKDEQCLYIRIANRKGYIFHLSRLAYEEIESDAYQGLLIKSLIRKVEQEDYLPLLSTMTKEGLFKIANSHELKDVRISWPKSHLVEFIFKNLSYHSFVDSGGADNHFVQLQSEVVDFLIYLYFGKAHDDLKSFTLRDLDIVYVRDNASFKSRFIDSIEAKLCFYYSRLLKRFDEGKHVFEQAANELLLIDDCSSEYARLLKGRVVYKIGQYYEKQKNFDKAISIYQLVDLHESNERVVRLEYNQGNKAQAKALLERMIEDPTSDDEYFFAIDFYARKFDGQKLSASMELLRSGETIYIDDIHRNNPENGAASYFRREQWRAYHTENHFWQTLFGLLFWQELFETDEALHSGFDRVPHCLKNKTFNHLYKIQIDKKLTSIRAGKGLAIVLQAISAAWGTPNGIFNWYAVNMEAIQDFFQHASLESIAKMIELMTKDYDNVCDGFPDLMLVNAESLKFVEIKAEGDLVRRNQLTRLSQLQQAGFIAEICKVNYRYDPNQVYVVIDTETTGGRAASERVTEVGAVKIQNHQVIDEWHSLINPQRRIPFNITALTGITNEMVQDAPLFSEIADSLSEFMQDAVFVAHNVNFDYGFLAEEYRRIEKSFRYPKFCTVTGMRRHYPGQDSYSLGHLCERYNVPLERHHRALHDAKAAAYLLSMINKRRDELGA